QLDYHYPLGLKYMYRAIYRHTKAGPQRRADHVVTTSGWGEAFMRERFGLPDVGSIRNGVDAGRFHPADPAERDRLRRGLDFRRFTALVPGRFALEKNQLAAVRAARYAPGLDFVFAGDMDSSIGTAAQGLVRALRLRNVRFLGRRWDMPDLYRAADALLQPTLAENQSLVTLEAMASGLPVVTTPIPAQAELIRDGVTGLLVPPRPTLLAQALRALAAHPERARELGLTARQHVLHHHTLDTTAAQVADVLRGMTGR
uniref:glycosyltransferase family 4 protein n=1 Tax=Deinococcus sp. TaxID=47478 RepID=UPI00286990CD